MEITQERKVCTCETEGGRGRTVIGIEYCTLSDRLEVRRLLKDAPNGTPALIYIKAFDGPAEPRQPPTFHVYLHVNCPHDGTCVTTARWCLKYIVEPLQVLATLRTLAT